VLKKTSRDCLQATGLLAPDSPDPSGDRPANSFWDMLYFPRYTFLFAMMLTVRSPVVVSSSQIRCQKEVFSWCHFSLS